MRVLALLLLSLAAVAHADVLIRSEEPSDVPGLHQETFYVVDDSPEARSADGGSPVKGIMTHTSVSGPRALAALFGSSSDNGRWSSWMDQQVGALSGVRQALMPAFVEAPPRRRGCSRHKKAMAAAEGMSMEAAAVPHTYSSLDDALLQRMAATRLTPQLLSALMAAADRDAPEIIVAVGSQGDRPRPQVAFTDSSFEAGAAGASRAAEPRQVLAVLCDETGCTEQLQGDESHAVQSSQTEFLPSSRVFDARSRAAWNPDEDRRVSFEEMANQRRGMEWGDTVSAPWEGDASAWGPEGPAPGMLSPTNPGLILFVFLCGACTFVWARLAILCCTLRQCGNRRHRRRGKKAGKELLEPLAPESAAADSLAIYTDALCAPPRGLHPPVSGARPYGVQAAAEHTTVPPQGNAYVTIQYVPLQSEGAGKA